MEDGEGWGFKSIMVDAVLNHPDFNFGWRNSIRQQLWGLATDTTQLHPPQEMPSAEGSCLHTVHQPSSPCAVARQCKGRKALPSGLAQDFSEGPSASDTCGTDWSWFFNQGDYSGLPRTEVSVLNWDSPAWSITLFAAAPQFNFSSCPNLFHLLSEMLPLPPKNSP